MKQESPSAADVKKLREQVQKKQNIGITAAIDICAAAVHVDRRSWQKWEHADRKMHPAFWELANIKLKSSL